MKENTISQAFVPCHSNLEEAWHTIQYFNEIFKMVKQC